MVIGDGVNVSFDFEPFLDSLVVSLDDRRGVSALGPLIDGGRGLDDFDRIRGGETKTPTLDVDETISGAYGSSETA